MRLFFILFFPAICFAQPKISGLGIYKLGVTTVDSLNKYNFYEVKKGEEGGPGCLIVRKFVNTGTIIGGIPISNLELWFYADKLYRIKCDYSDEVRDALLTKYGKPTTQKSKKAPVNCVYKLTGRTSDVYMNEVTRRDWVNGRFSALLMYDVQYNKECKPVDESYLAITDSTVHGTAIGCEVDNVTKEVDQMQKERKAKLKDF